ncbi:hypothetical protein [Coralloluteibacterium stylophorae]|uniref:Lipoprotein n=1 Tax=Coralloluteibacterium stylophorae TaxID=1776034 RepID=A0A8J7VX79_9GAMM|nr:hypothetical protein [Coralloluteibacterium stylophorae]MBS7458729.1 hypothetical protein [Coralloluteibacterium stylophorae]
MQPSARVRATVLAALALVSLAGCAGTARERASAPAGGGDARSAQGVDTGADSATGIGVCDAYLERYRRCHAVIGAYRADQIEGRYQALRDKLLERVATPEGADRAAAECRMLADAMDAALEGRACPANADD